MKVTLSLGWGTNYNPPTPPANWYDPIFAPPCVADSEVPRKSRPSRLTVEQKIAKLSPRARAGVQRYFSRTGIFNRLFKAEMKKSGAAKAGGAGVKQDDVVRNRKRVERNPTTTQTKLP